MKILHTSDWHIGKKLISRDRLFEQREVLEELVSICDEQNVELVLVAGDVFDTYLPSAEAESLFFEYAKKLSSKDRAVLIISGNHDDGSRLSASTPFLQENGVYVIDNQSKPLPTGDRRKVHVLDSGEGFVVFENDKGEKVYINALPYPNEARFKEGESSESFEEKAKRWIERGRKGYHGGMPEIFLSHLFVAGGQRSESERDIDLGGARAVSLSSLPECDYIALGHLHKKQHFTKQNAWYSGSLLQYSFDEAGLQKFVILLETDKTKLLSAKEIPLTKGKQLLRVSAHSVEEGLSLLQENQDKLVELTLFLEAPLTSLETRSLAANSCLVSLIPQIAVKEGEQSTLKRGKSKAQLFKDYYSSVYGVSPSDELNSLFLEIAQEEVKE